MLFSNSTFANEDDVCVLVYLCVWAYVLACVRYYMCEFCIRNTYMFGFFA